MFRKYTYCIKVVVFMKINSKEFKSLNPIPKTWKCVYRNFQTLVILFIKTS